MSTFDRNWRQLQLETLVDLSLSIGGVRGEEELVEELLQRAVGTLDARAGAVVTLHAAGVPALERHVGLAHPMEMVRGLLGGSALERLAAGRLVHVREGLLEEELGELVVAPMNAQDALLGFVALGDKETREGRTSFSEGDLRFLRSLASLGAAAIATSRRVTAIERDRQRLAEENRVLRDHARREGFVGESPQIRQMLELVRRVAPTDVAVMLRGESGVGKERVAQLIHGFSDRLAAGGTLFLDEIGDLGLALQAKLLRVVQERELERLGGREPVPVDLRLITATHRDLEAMVEEGKFRRDLYYRLRVVVIAIPPLRERRTDIPLLAGHFLRLYGERLGRPGLRLSRGAMAALMAHPYPGNVRELENVIQAAVALAPEETITEQDLAFDAASRPGEGEGGADSRHRQKHPLSETEARCILVVQIASYVEHTVNQYDKFTIEC